MTEGTVLSPHTAPALSDDDGSTCSGVIASGGGGGETPFERILIIEHCSKVDSFKRDMNRSSSHTHQEIGRYTKEPAFIFPFTERGG